MTEPIDPMEKLAVPFETEAERADAQLRIQKMRQGNTAMLRELQANGVNLDFGTAMLQSYMETMVELGLIEGDHWIAMQLKWEISFHQNLREARAQVQQAIDRQRLQQGIPGAGGLIIPGANGGPIGPRG